MFIVLATLVRTVAGVGSSPLLVLLAVFLGPVSSLLLCVLLAIAVAAAGMLVGSVVAAAPRCRLAQNWCRLLLAFIQFFVDLELLKQRINIHGNPTDVGIVLVCLFLLTPTHQNATELSVSEGEVLACHQAVVVKMREELDATVQLS